MTDVSDPAPEHEQRGPRLPILDHPLEAPTVFAPGELVRAVQVRRRLEPAALPAVCILEFDGDLTDELVNSGEATPCASWPCFHTSMWTFAVDGLSCGLIPRTIGGPYTVLVAEQLAACGVQAVMGLASAGRVDSSLPLPAVVIASGAFRDEGTSYHYLPASPTVDAWPGSTERLAAQIAPLGITTRIGPVWTTDAPYRETEEQFMRYRGLGALAVEMQAASLFAFSARQRVPTGLVAHVTNAPDHGEQSFDKNELAEQKRLLQAIGRAGHELAAASRTARGGPGGRTGSRLR